MKGSKIGLPGHIFWMRVRVVARALAVLLPIIVRPLQVLVWDLGVTRLDFPLQMG